MAAPRLELKDVERLVQELKGAQPVAKRGLMQKAELLLKTVQDVWRNEGRLCRLHGVHDGSVPDDAAPAARLKLVNQRSFAVDSVEGVGVAELLAAIEATCNHGIMILLYFSTLNYYHHDPRHDDSISRSLDDPTLITMSASCLISQPTRQAHR
jgi:hypothetical protein